jgi:3-isopropylmalate/(R)-2-methylmalate dehydratase small subunit
MQISIQGSARVVGDDVNTDYIISSSRKKETTDPQILKRYLFEALDPELAGSIEPGDLVIAGANFGCGSAMEIAVSVLLASGIKAVLARSFARTFYRNAINNGLVPVECDTSQIHDGHRVIVSLAEGAVWVKNETTGHELVASSFPAIMLDILAAGGLVPYFRVHHDFVADRQ